jgi:hypothetical protein
VALTVFLGACGDGATTAGRGDLATTDDNSAVADAGSVLAPRSDAGADLSVEDLACPHGGAVGKIEVAFDCFEITTVSCKDLSNVVIELADGSRQRFDGLSGQRGVFSGTGDHAGAQIVGVWVKAGNNKSGDGPGYGERFDAPTQECPPVAPPGDAGCSVADGTCNPPSRTPPDAGCFVADGTCNPPAPPPPDAGCFVADGVCVDVPKTPKPPVDEPPIGI